LRQIPRVRGIAQQAFRADRVPAHRRSNRARRFASAEFHFFTDPARFEADADSLAEALQTDIGWFRQHTDYGEGARRWIAAGRPAGLLLRSPALEVAEHWLVSRPREFQDVVRKL
jgi:hypothetical protein